MADLIGISLILIFIKMFIAIIFGYREAEQLAVIGLVNFIIYGALCIWINYDIIEPASGGIIATGMMAFGMYLFGSLVAALIEVIVYMACLNKLAWEPREKRWQASLIAAAYTIVANAVSIFVIALFI